MASSFMRFIDHTQQQTTVGRTPLYEWSARSRNLYLTTQDTHNTQTSRPPAGFEPTISAGERPQTYWTARSLGPAVYLLQGKKKPSFTWSYSCNQEWSGCRWPLTLIWYTPSYAFMAWTLFQQRKTWTSLDAPSVLCYKQLGRGWSRQNTIVLCLILYRADDDMFQPLWAIFRSQNV